MHLLSMGVARLSVFSNTVDQQKQWGHKERTKLQKLYLTQENNI